MARPPGCAFLGAKPTQTMAVVGSSRNSPMKIIADSGSDITLISKRALDSLLDKPRIKGGQKINLLQVTGNSSISGYVELDVLFQAQEGSVKITVEAYVVEGMTTPFILGNDFTDQYSISTIKNNGESYLHFGTCNRTLRVENAVGSNFLNEQGQAFKIRVASEVSDSMKRIKRHRRNQKLKRKINRRESTGEVRARKRIVIAPSSSKKVHVSVFHNSDESTLLVERNFIYSGSPENCIGIPDSLIDVTDPFLHISNFTDEPFVISEGQQLGQVRNPKNWLDREQEGNGEGKEAREAHASFIRNLVSTWENLTVITNAEITSKAQRNATEENCPEAQEPINGGPKTLEVPPESVPRHRLLQEVDISSALKIEQRASIEAVILKHEQAFGLDGRLGNYEAKVDIQLKEGTQPISLAPFPASPAKREVIDKQMDAWISLGVIEPSKSPWAALVFIVYRNSKPRMVIDLRRFNACVIPDKFPLPKQDDILQALTGAQWLSTLDALSGFTQLTMTDSASEKLVFRTHRGLWQFRRMPFGYRNGPSVFQRVMQNVLAPFLWIFALVYIDDIVIFSLTFEDHINHLDQVFKAISDANITLSPSKCHFAYQSLLLLGQKVSRLGLSTHKEKVDAILAIETPKNAQELQTFLGMMVYFASYIPFYAWIAHPLFDLIRKDREWEWTEMHEEAFKLCKEVLTNAPIRGYAKPGLPYRVYTDACDYGLAGILQQVQPILIRDLRGTKIYDRLKKAYEKKEPVPNLVSTIHNDIKDVPIPSNWGKTFEVTTVYVERVIAYWSRVLKSAERNYSPTEREALALKEALIKFQPYLEGERILAITDHAALTWSKTFQNINRRLLTWGTVFSAYPDLKIVHRAGRVHSNVDPISRLRRQVPFTQNPINDDNKVIELSTDQNVLRDMYEQLGEWFEERLLTVASNFVQIKDRVDDGNICNDEVRVENQEGIESSIMIPTSQNYSVVVGISEDELRKWKDDYEKDNHFSTVLKSLRQGLDTYPQYHYSEDGLIYFEDALGNDRLCVPENQRKILMEETHEGLTETGHAGYHKTYNRLTAGYYWPRMSRDVKMFVTSCDICQKIKPKREAPAGLLRPIPIPSQPFEVVTMDFIPDLPVSNGYNNVLVIVDKLTKYGIFIPCSTKISEEETARLFFKYVISHYGIPRQVITDRDTRWRNEFWGEICRLMGMKRALTTAYHPQADGQTEILNQTLEIALRTYVDSLRTDWTDHIDGLMLAYNTTPHSATTFSPAYLLRGYTPITRSSIFTSNSNIDRNIPPNLESTEQRAVDIMEAFEADRMKALDALKKGQAYQQLAYNRGHRDIEFEEGDLVLLNPHSLELLKKEEGRGIKLLTRYEGPFEILKKISPVTYQLRLPVSYGINPVINIAHLVKYVSSPPEFGERTTKESIRDTFEELPEVEVQEILKERLHKGKGKGRRQREYWVRFVGFNDDHNEWLTKKKLRNAPKILEAWRKKSHSVKHL